MRDGERLVHVLLDQEHRDAALVDLADDVEILLHQQRRQARARARRSAAASARTSARVRSTPWPARRPTWCRRAGARRSASRGKMRKMSAMRSGDDRVRASPDRRRRAGSPRPSAWERPCALPGCRRCRRRSIRCVASPVMSMPSNTMRPARAGVSPRIERTSVVLPEPLEPSRQVMLPASTSATRLAARPPCRRR